MPYIEVIAKNAVFGGRATMREYWLFQAIHVSILVGLSILAWGDQFITFRPLVWHLLLGYPFAPVGGVGSAIA